MPTSNKISARRALLVQIFSPDVNGISMNYKRIHTRRKSIKTRMKVKVRACFVISSCSSRGKVAKVSNFVPIRKGIAVWGESERESTKYSSVQKGGKESRASIAEDFVPFKVSHEIGQ
jgi:hypothetical protein